MAHLSSFKLRDFRCFRALECEWVPGLNAVVGPNAQGKTSLLEAACVLLRLASPRSPGLGPLVRLGATGFVVDGFHAGAHLQFYCSARRRKLALDSVVQAKTGRYLETGTVVWFSNHDLALVRGSAEERRRYLDFVASQISPVYRRHLRDYDRALRSRNRLLKAPVIRWREVAAFDHPLVEAGTALTAARSALVEALRPAAQEAHRAISAEAGEGLTLRYRPGAGESLEHRLEETREESIRLRQTLAGPHRDELELELNNLATSFASEGQQRTLALALRLAQAREITRQQERPPLFLLDDIFGELDPRRRNALLHQFPAGSQQIITTTHLDWAQVPISRGYALEGGALRLL